MNIGAIRIMKHTKIGIRPRECRIGYSSTANLAKSLLKFENRSHVNTAGLKNLMHIANQNSQMSYPSTFPLVDGFFRDKLVMLLANLSTPQSKTFWYQGLNVRPEALFEKINVIKLHRMITQIAIQDGFIMKFPYMHISTIGTQ